MKSRMERYIDSDDSPRRTSKNDSLYEELYKEKPVLRSNITVLDNVDEIDINKIRQMVDNREDYRKNRNYERIINNKKEEENGINYEFEEINDNDYDINEILEKKRSDKSYNDENKVRKLNSKEYEELKELVIKDKIVVDKLNDENLTKEEKLTQIIDTLVQNNEVTDLFANLRDTPEDKKEEVFYTNSNKFEAEDFKDEVEDKKGSKAFTIISIILILAVIGVFVWLEFFK